MEPKDIEYIAPPPDEQMEFFEWAALKQAIEDVAEAARRDPQVMERLMHALKGGKHEH